MKKLYFAFLLAMSSSSYAQSPVDISVVDQQTGKALEFATLSFYTKDKAFNTDAKGKIKLNTAGINLADSVCISNAGYESISLSIQEFLRKRTFDLSPKKKNNSSAAIQKGGKSAVLNDLGRNQVIRFAGLESRLDSFNFLQIAQRFFINEKGTVLKKLIIHRLAYPRNEKISKKMQYSHFRIRIYGVDSLNVKPGKELSNEIIDVKNYSDRKIEVKLDAYNIIIPDHIFFVAIEWLRIPDNESKMEVYVSQADILKHQDLTLNSKLIGYTDRTIISNYRPAIGISPIRSNQQNAWALTFSNVWKPFTYFAPEFTDFAITAEVQY